MTLLKNKMHKQAAVQSVVLPLSLIFVLASSGCMTTRNFGSLPSDPMDLQLSPQEIRSKYPEIAFYEKKFRGFVQNTPLASSVIDVWGEPDHRKSHWHYFVNLGFGIALAGAVTGVDGALAFATGVAYVIRPVPPKTFAWEKGKYCIEARIDTTFPDFRQRIVHWKWSEMQDQSVDRICDTDRPISAETHAVSS